MTTSLLMAERWIIWQTSTSANKNILNGNVTEKYFVIVHGLLFSVSQCKKMFEPVSVSEVANVIAYGILISALLWILITALLGILISAYSALLDYGSRVSFCQIIQYDGQQTRVLVLLDVDVEDVILLANREFEIIDVDGPLLNLFCFQIMFTFKFLIEKVFKRKRPVKEISFGPVMNESGDRRGRIHRIIVSEYE